MDKEHYNMDGRGALHNMDREHYTMDGRGALHNMDGRGALYNMDGREHYTTWMEWGGCE